MTNYERKNNWHKRNRSRFEIIASMLEAVKNNNGASQYSLRKHMSSNFTEVKKYLESLTEMGFIETDIKEGRVLYRATEEGLNFLRQYCVLLEMMSGTRMCGNIVLPKCVKLANPNAR
jgi:predicted transcriptional regulator